MKNKFFHIPDIKIKHVFRVGFWKVLFSGMLGWFGIVTIFGGGKTKMSIGSNIPVTFTEDAVCKWEVELSGYIFWKPIYIYELTDVSEERGKKLTEMSKQFKYQQK